MILDGITATAVLWEGLGQFFEQDKTLQFTIPNRLTESHGLSQGGMNRIADQGASLIITCDTGSNAHAEIDYAQALGIDVIVIDHHTIPSARPAAVAVINPRTLPHKHPLATLSGVAVAYKLVEAFYERHPDIPTAPLEDLLDLVAIGLVADLVHLVSDGRYLAQRGLQRLKRQLDQPTRPVIAALLKLCKKNGDRPADIAFGLGPRINALSRIHGDAHDKDTHCALALAYPAAEILSAEQCWQQLAVAAKYAARTGHSLKRVYFQKRLTLSEHSLKVRIDSPGRTGVDHEPSCR